MLSMPAGQVGAAQRWNASVNAALADPALAARLAAAACTLPSCRQLAAACVGACVKLSQSGDTLDAPALLRPALLLHELAALEQRLFAVPALVQSLSVLQLFLVVAAARIATRGKSDTNFQARAL